MKTRFHGEIVNWLVKSRFHDFFLVFLSLTVKFFLISRHFYRQTIFVGVRRLVKSRLMILSWSNGIKLHEQLTKQDSFQHPNENGFAIDENAISS